MTASLKPPPIGALRRRLVLEALVQTSDGAGGRIGGWSQVAVIWGAVHPRHGTENFSSDGIEGRVTHDIWVRPRSDFAPAQRLRLNDGRLFNIRGALQPDPFVNRMRLICEQRNQ